MMVFSNQLSLTNDHIWTYQQDKGEGFSQKSNGYTYGWSGDNSANVFERNNNKSQDERYDRGILLDGKSWEIELKKGHYRVLVVAGDADSPGARYKILAEDVVIVDGTSTEAFPWISGMETVEVTDGKLTITGAPEITGNKLAYIHISSPIEEKFSSPEKVELPLKVNSGGYETGDFLADKRWLENADYGYFLEVFTQNQDYKILDETRIAPNELEPVLRSMRQARDGVGNWFGYRVRLDPGNYYLTLIFAEYEKDEEKRRVAEISINDEVFIEKFDYFNEIGFKNYHEIKKQVNVTDHYLEFKIKNIKGFYPSGATLSGFLVAKDSSVTGISPFQPDMIQPPSLYAFSNALYVKNLAIGSKVQLFDLKGNLVYSARAKTTSITIGQEKIKPAVYMLRVTHENSPNTHKQLVPVR